MSYHNVIASLIRKTGLIERTPKIFCLSAQKTGTTSVGDFYSQNGFATARWYHSDKEDWPLKWYRGDFEAIFTSRLFRYNQVFEDNPWWFPEFYKILYHRFPDAKFILFKRPDSDWFTSMAKAYHGHSVDSLQIHAKIYHREDEFYNKVVLEKCEQKRKIALENFTRLWPHRDHYLKIYNTRNREIIDFFSEKSPERFFLCDLYEESKWDKLAEFSNIKRRLSKDVHSNATKNR